MKRTPLLELHKRLGAKLTEFGGWDMPLQYSGVIAEHRAVREDVGLFDVTHLGKLRVTDGDALQVAVTADVFALAPGHAKYALCLTEDGGCIDDVFVYRIAEGEWLVVPNASNVDAVAQAIGPAEDQWDRWAILALQGPRSFEVFSAVFPNHDAPSLKLHTWMPLDGGLVARTGYTGERGFELYVPFGDAEAVYERLLEAGAAPIGLGARDTLRLEMGYALYGHELAPDINPLEASLGWAIAWDAPFRGREALLEIKAQGPARRLFGIVCNERGIPRQGQIVLGPDDSEVGRVTSGNFSPTLNTGIALALGNPPEGRVAIDVRGRRVAGDIVKPPFIK